MAKKQIAEGLSGLLAPKTPTEQATKTERGQVERRVVSFSTDAELAEKIDYIAYYDRKAKSTVITEALRAYVAAWTPAPQEKPRKL